MRIGVLSKFCRLLAAWRVPRLTVVLGVVTALVGASPAIASASAARPLRVPEVHAAPGHRLTLGQAPAGLRMAVRRTLGTHTAPAATDPEKKEWTGSAAGEYFGNSVAIAGSTAVVGAEGANSAEGAVYVYVHSGKSWSEQAALTDPAAAAGDRFGDSVAITGSAAATLVVGAFGANSATGAAYVFTRSGTTWSEQAKLTASNGAAGDYFGSSAAIAGSYAVIGASDGGSGPGSAYVFNRSASTGAWSQQAGLADPYNTDGDYFGDSVAIDGSNVLVGADGAKSGSGVAVLFTRSGKTWTPQVAFADGAGDNYLGSSVALAGSTTLTVAVGADGTNSYTGAVYVWMGSGTTWTAEVGVAGPAADTEFGDSVAIVAKPTTDTIVAGAYGVNSGAGAAYVLTGSGSSWSEQGELTAADGAADDLFGESVALSGTTPVVGALGRESYTGAAYVFKVS
jgi:hypothetical protein